MSVEFMWTAFSGTVNINRMALETSDKQGSTDRSEVSILVCKAMSGNRFAFNQLIQMFQDDISILAQVPTLHR